MFMLITIFVLVPIWIILALFISVLQSCGAKPRKPNYGYWLHTSHLKGQGMFTGNKKF